MSVSMPPQGFYAPQPDDRHQYRRGVRYGASLASVLLGVYLVMSWNMSLLVSRPDALLVLVTLVQLAIAVAALAGGLALAPSSPGRSLGAAALAVVLVVASVVLTYMRVSGQVRGGGWLLWTLTNPATAALLAALLGWLIVRRRPAISYLLLVAAFLPAFVRYRLQVAGVSSGAIWFSDLFFALAVGVGVAWVARALEAVRRQPPQATPGYPGGHPGGYPSGPQSFS